MEKRAVRDVISRSLMKLILDFLIPMLFGLPFQQFYNMMDTIIVGKYLGVSALASVGSTGSVDFMIIGLCMGVYNGPTIPAAQKFGEKNKSAMRKFVANGGQLAATFAAITTVVVYTFCRQILVWMRTLEDIIDGTYSYIFVIFMGIPVIYLYNLLSDIIRSLGDSTTPVIFLLISSMMGIILGLFTIIVLKMGVTEAAWATAISQAVSDILCLLYMRRRFTILKVQGEEWKPDAYAMRMLCDMGIPIGLQCSIMAIGSVILQTAVNSLGPVTVTSVMTDSKINMFFCCPSDAMGTMMVTYGGQNVGAKKLDHVHQGIKPYIALGAVYLVLALVALYFFGDVMALLFVDAEGFEILKNTRQFLMANVAFYFPLALVNIVRFMIRELGYSKFAIIAGVYEMDARCTIAFLAGWFDYNAVCLADPLAWIAAGIFLIPAYLYVMRRLRRRLGRMGIHPVTGASVVAAETRCR